MVVDRCTVFPILWCIAMQYCYVLLLAVLCGSIPLHLQPRTLPSLPLHAPLQPHASQPSPPTSSHPRQPHSSHTYAATPPPPTPTRSLLILHTPSLQPPQPPTLAPATHSAIQPSPTSCYLGHQRASSHTAAPPSSHTSLAA